MRCTRADGRFPLDDRLLPRTADGRGDPAPIRARPRSRRRARRRPCWRSTPTLTAASSSRSPFATATCAPTPARCRCRAARSTRRMPVAEAAALREAWEEVGLRAGRCAHRRRARRRLDPGQQLRAAPVRRHGRRAADPRAPRRRGGRDRRAAARRALFDPDVIGVEEFVARGVTLTRRRVSLRRASRVWGATALTLGMLAHVLDGVGDALSGGSGPSSSPRGAARAARRAGLRGAATTLVRGPRDPRDPTTGRPSRSVTTAPARSAMSPAAATSHGERPPFWTKASKRPLAT